METTIIDGKKIAADVLDEVKRLILKHKLSPKLLIIQVGNDPASTQYVTIKQKRAAEVGIHVEIAHIADSHSEEHIYHHVQHLIEQRQNDFDGIMIQLPLPETVITTKILALIPKEKDVDGLLLEKSLRNTAVAEAVLRILDKYSGKGILVLGDAPFVGGSIIRLLSKANPGRIHIVNIDSPNIPERLSRADVIVSCIGKPHIYNAQQLKPGAILIDVGTSPDQTGKIVGDFDTSRAFGHLAAYTPVPGGVGPVTVAMLLKNLVSQAKENA